MERTARWDGATHVACERCSATIDKGKVLCDSCRQAKAWEVYKTCARQEWDGQTPLFSDVYDKYFFGEEELREYCEYNDMAPSDLRLYLCVPNYARELDASYFDDDLADDADDLPYEIAAAITAFNATLKAYGKPLSWSPGNVAAVVTADWANDDAAPGQRESEGAR